MQTHITSTSAAMTEKVAEKLGQRVQGGEIIELVSDLGGGKTTFVRGLARGMGSRDSVRSPSFTLANQYQSGELTLYHFDFYRLNDPGILAHELAEITADKKAVIVVEWATIVAEVLTMPHLVISLKQTDERERDIRIDYPEQYNYLFSGENLTS
jgi:tRNA threonylcarbamoyladenosine biosynthesis protein TsaE